MENNIKFFGLNNISLEASLRKVADDHNVRLRPERRKEHDSYYPQVPESIRRDAAKMAEHYELFYCLELSIRELIRSKLEEADPEWWNSLVPPVVRENAEKNKTREVSSGVTPRSDDMLSYTTFGELGEIIKANWTLFSDTLTNPKAVEVTLSRLNLLRAPIAHCSMLQPDEVLRLRLSLADWFRLME